MKKYSFLLTKKVHVLSLMFALCSFLYSHAQPAELYDLSIVDLNNPSTVSVGSSVQLDFQQGTGLPFINCGGVLSIVGYKLDYYLVDQNTSQFYYVGTYELPHEGVNCAQQQLQYWQNFGVQDIVIPCNIPSGDYWLRIIPDASNIGSTYVPFNGGFPTTEILISALDVNVGGGSYLVAYSGSGLYTTPKDVLDLTITNSAPVMTDITFTTSNTTCPSLSTGQAVANPVGGSGNFSYLWSDGQTTQTATGLSGGAYTVEVTDNVSGCTMSSTFFNSQAVVGTSYVPSVSLSAIHICEGNPGQIIASTTGGSAPYSYVWNTSQSGSYISVSSAGTYSVTSEDADGCVASESIDIIESDNPTISLPREIRTCNENYQLCGNADEDPNGNFDYTWSYYDQSLMQVVLVSEDPCFTPVATSGYGTYYLQVTNQYGCTSTHTIDVRTAKGCGGAGGPAGMTTTVHPNPVASGESFKVGMNSDSETATLEIIDMKTGKIVYTSELSKDQPAEHAISDFKIDNSPSVYIIKVYNENGISIDRLIVK